MNRWVISSLNFRPVEVVLLCILFSYWNNKIRFASFTRLITRYHLLWLRLKFQNYMKSYWTLEWSDAILPPVDSPEVASPQSNWQIRSHSVTPYSLLVYLTRKGKEIRHYVLRAFRKIPRFSIHEELFKRMSKLSPMWAKWNVTRTCIDMSWPSNLSVNILPNKEYFKRSVYLS